MDRHDIYETLLARREELSPVEEARLHSHLQSCRTCQETAAAFACQDALIRALPPVRPALELRKQVLLSPPRSHRHWPRFPITRRRSLVSFVAVIAASVAGLGLAPLLRQSPPTPANAYTLLASTGRARAPFPYSGTAVITYRSLDENVLPDQAAYHLAFHQIITSWFAAAPDRFRIDIRTVSPAIDQGTLTVAQAGSQVVAYDTRTGTAGVSRSTDSQLLSYLQAGASYGAPTASPSASIRRYLESLTAIPTAHVVHPFARLAGGTRLLGREADIVDFGPTVITCLSTKPNQPGCSSARGHGTARVWIDARSHLVLRYEEFGLDNPRMNRADFEYRLLSLSFGQGKGRALNYRPPVVPRRSAPLKLIWDASSINHAGHVPAGFLAAPPPPSRPHSPTMLQEVEAHPTGPLPSITAVNILYGEGRYTRDRRQAGQIRIPHLVGHFLYVQERVRKTGLPGALKNGRPLFLGSCRAWAGTYFEKQTWLAFSRGSVSALVTTDALSRAQLVQYVRDRLCH